MIDLTDSSLVHTRLLDVLARRRIADTLLGVALDAVEPFACDYLSADEYGRLCGRVQESVEAATEAAMTSITRELALVADTDPEIAQGLRRAQQSHL